MPEFRFIFTAEDYDRTTAFYTETLGLPVVSTWDEDGRGMIVAAAGEGEVEIFEHTGPGEPAKVSGAAVAWEVPDVDAEIERLRVIGVTPVIEPADQPWGHRNATIEDPEGLRITLFTVVDREH